MVWGTQRGIEDLIARVQGGDGLLTSLCLMPGRRFNEADASALCQALAGNNVVRELSISSHAVSVGAAAAVAAMLAANRTLRSLDLGNSTFGDAGLEALAPGIAASCSLEELHLQRKGLTSACCAPLAAALVASWRQHGAAGEAAHAGVQQLLLAGNAIGAEGLATLLEGVNSCSCCSLKLLDLSECSLEGAQAMQALSAALLSGALLQLRMLRLDGNLLGYEGAAELAAGLAPPAGASRGVHFQRLHLRGCGLGAQGVAALAAALPADLAVLDLSDNEAMQDAGCTSLAQALATGAAPHLSRLLLCNCGIGDTGCAALGKALASGARGAAAAAVECSTVPAAAAAPAEAAAEAVKAASPSEHVGLHCERGSNGAVSSSKGSGGIALDLSGNTAGIAALQALASGAPVTSLCLHACKLGSEVNGDASPGSAFSALLHSVVAPGRFQQLAELDISANELTAGQLADLLAALHPAHLLRPAATPACSSGGNDVEAVSGCKGGHVESGLAEAKLPWPCLQLLVVAANPGAMDELVAQAIEALQAIRPGLDVVRRSADSGEAGPLSLRSRPR